MISAHNEDRVVTIEEISKVTYDDSEDQNFTVDNETQIFTVEEMSNATFDKEGDINEEANRLQEEDGNVDTRNFREDSSQLSEDHSRDDAGFVFSKEYLEERKQAFERDMHLLREQLPPPPLEDPNIVSLLMRIQLLGKISQEPTIERLFGAVDHMLKDPTSAPSDLNSLSNMRDSTFRQCLDVPLRVDRMRRSSNLDRKPDVYRDFKSPEPYAPFVDRDRAKSKTTSQQYDENPYPRKGKTVIPRKLVHIHAILDLGYPFKEEVCHFWEKS